MVLHNQSKKAIKNSEINMIKYLNSRISLNKNELDLLNRKRLIQTLDLFNSKYVCKICCSKLRYKADEIIHAKLKHNPLVSMQDRIQCPQCEMKFTSFFKLKFHLMKMHLNEKPYKCKECSSRFYSFLLLKKHCYKQHLNVNLSSSFSSSFNSSTTLSSSTSSEKFKSFINLIDYDNSNIDCEKRISLLPNSTNNPLSVNSDLNFNYFHQLNKMNNSKNVDTLIDFLNDSKHQQQINNSNYENTFTIITQLNVIDCNLCSKITHSNSEYLNHVWQEHLILNKQMINRFICWACVLANKTNPINTIDKYKFHTLVDLNVHCKQFKHSHQKAFKCSQCIELYFDDLATCKSHYLKEHTKISSQEDSKSYLDDIIDLATNLDSDTPFRTPFKLSNTSTSTNTSYKFVFACFKCEQIYSSYDCILNHFLNDCNASSSMSSRTKCSQCQLTFTNIKQIEIHLKQHDYLAFNELINKKNIKMSKNNKSYSIDAIVNSMHQNQPYPKRIDDIATKMMKKSQETSSVNSTTTSSLFDVNLANNFLFNIQQQLPLNLLNTPKRLYDLNEQYDFLTKMIKSNESYYLNNSNLIKKPSTLYSSSSISSNQPLTSSFSFPNMFKLETNKPLLQQQHQQLQIKCDYCGYCFSSLIELNEHKILHQALNPKRPFKCHLCQVTFAKTDQLTRHMIVHQASEADSVCSVCFSSFSRKQDLDRHMLFHSK